jgi:hypothetical protein
MISSAILSLLAALEDEKILTRDDILTIGLTKNQLFNLCENPNGNPLGGLVYCNPENKEEYVGLGCRWIAVDG